MQKCFAPFTTQVAHGTRARVARVRAEYPNQLDYSGFCWAQEGATVPQDACVLSQQGHAGTAVVFKHLPFDPKVSHQDGRVRGQATLDVCGQRHYVLMGDPISRHHDRFA